MGKIKCLLISRLPESIRGIGEVYFIGDRIAIVTNSGNGVALFPIVFEKVNAKIG